MNKIINYTTFSVLLWVSFALLVYMGKFFWGRIIFFDALIITYSIFNYIFTYNMYKKYLRKEYKRDYINIGQNHFGIIPIGIIGRDMDVSPCVRDSYKDFNLTRLKWQFRLSLLFIIITIIIITVLN